MAREGCLVAKNRTGKKPEKDAYPRGATVTTMKSQYCKQAKIGERKKRYRLR
jgi:hypothetical protein